MFINQFLRPSGIMGQRASCYGGGRVFISGNGYKGIGEVCKFVCVPQSLIVNR
jgi:hypothetical protein